MNVCVLLARRTLSVVEGKIRKGRLAGGTGRRCTYAGVGCRTKGVGALDRDSSQHEEGTGLGVTGSSKCEGSISVKPEVKCSGPLPTRRTEITHCNRSTTQQRSRVWSYLKIKSQCCRLPELEVGFRPTLPAEGLSITVDTYQ